MMSLWDALRMNMMISYQELVRTFPNNCGRGVSITNLHRVENEIVAFLLLQAYVK
ncbi:ydjO [Escherichia coli]|nr:ydjO [Escherichia coli]